jgi:hypothetical protein
MGVKAVLAAASIAVASGSGITGSAAHALTLHRAPFLLQPERGIGFEERIDGTLYSENGIDVSYEGYGSRIWAGSQAAEGSQSWYVDGGGFGFTRIRFGETVKAFQFAGATGWPSRERFGRDGPQPLPAIQFRLLKDGAVVAEGLFANAPVYSGFRAFGFSGIAFDEAHLQSQSGDLAFDEGGFDALALDALAVGGPIGGVIPEPASWALMILGFGLVGATARRRRAAAA